MTCGGALNIDSRYQRVANFRRITLNTFFDMVGAMGLDDPDKLGTSGVLAQLQSRINSLFAGARYWKLGHRIAPSDLCGNNRRSMRPHPSAS